MSIMSTSTQLEIYNWLNYCIEKNYIFKQEYKDFVDTLEKRHTKEKLNRLMRISTRDGVDKIKDIMTPKEQLTAFNYIKDLAKQNIYDDQLICIYWEILSYKNK